MNAAERRVMEQALEALEEVDGPITALLGSLLGSPAEDAPGTKVRASITALRAALAQEQATGSWHDGVLEGQLREREHWLAQQPESVQEPVAKVELMTTGGNAGLATRILEIDDHLRERLRPGQLLYTAPQPQRPPLTDEELDRLWRDPQQGYWDYRKFARAVERAVRGEE